MKTMDKRANYRIEGNTVKKLNGSQQASYEQSMSEWLNKREERQRREKNNQQKRVRLQKEQENRMTLSTFLFLSVLCGITFCVCLSYLQVKNELTNKSREIAVLESKIISLKDENMIKMEQVDSNVDLSYIYRVATQELGMVHPEADQIVKYQKTQSDFVKQYSSIPESQEDNFIEKIFNGSK